MNSPLQALPTYSQWRAWQTKIRAIKGQYCIFCQVAISAVYDSVVTIGCRDAVKTYRDNKVIVGCRVKVWDEEVTETAEGDEVVKLTSKIVPMSMTGPGCPSCQYLMTKLESEELTRYDKECREWHELHKPRLTYTDIAIVVNGISYRLVNKTWYYNGGSKNGMRVPTYAESELYKQHAATCEQHIVAGLEPWMRALGLTVSPYTPQPDSQTRTSSKRQVYIDVTEDVLQMPRAKRREDDIYTVAGVN